MQPAANATNPIATEGPNTVRENCGRVLVVTPKGPSLGEWDAAGVLAEIATDVARARGRVLLDMSRIEYMSSAGISMLVQLRELSMGEGGSLALSNLAKPIAGVLKTTKVDRLFTIAPSREKALAKLGKQG
ncbi:MAG: STAS domain-containing protein [Phycisphaerales bacterium JB060]